MTVSALSMTDLGEDDRRLVGRMIRDGYGVEDIEIATGYAAKDIRDCIAYWRHAGFLRPMLRGDMGGAKSNER